MCIIGMGENNSCREKQRVEEEEENVGKTVRTRVRRARNKRRKKE
jgi:hypothetical protein